MAALRLQHIHYRLAILLGLITYFLDQYSKYIILHTELPWRITNWMNIIFVENHGIVWGLSQDYGLYLALAGSVALIIILLTSDLWHNNPTACSLLVSGCLGNLTDRFHSGAVIDWVDWHVMGYHWPAFNLADAYLMIALALLMISNLTKQQR